MTRSTFAGLAAACGIAMTIGSGAALAQGAGPNATGMDIYSGGSKPSGTCPGLHWTMASARPNLHGYFYWNDGSGVSKGVGTSKPDGTFELNLTSIDGNGPVGTVTGKRASNGTLTATLKGQGCANMSVGAQRPEYHMSNG